MSRLDEFILRMQAQRACIDEVALRMLDHPGPVLEVGLGNGRTYDHLRLKFPQRAVYVFDREVAAHPDCIPPAELLTFAPVFPPMHAKNTGRPFLFMPMWAVRTGLHRPDLPWSWRQAGTTSWHLAPVWRVTN